MDPVSEPISSPLCSPLQSPTQLSPLAQQQSTSGSIQLSPPTQQQSPSGSTTTESTSIASSAAAGTDTVTIPNHWRPEVEDCLRKKCLTPVACQEMVRTVVSQLFARSQRPNRKSE